MNDLKDRVFNIPASFQAVSGALRKITIQTKVKILADNGDDDAAKKAAQEELARLMMAIERVAQPVICGVSKLSSGTKQYQVEFFVEHADAFVDANGVKKAANVPTVANNGETYDVDATLGDNIL